MITETQSTFKRDGSYANQFDEFGNLVIVDSTEKYLSVTLTREVYENTSISNIYTVDIEEFKDIPVKEDGAVSTLKSEKTKLQSQINTLTSELSKMANSSGKDALISASKDIIIGLRIKAGEGKLPSDFNTVFPYLPLKSSEAIQSDASSTGLGSGTANSTSTTTSTQTSSTELTGAQKGLIPSPQQCERQADIQFSPPTEFYDPTPPVLKPVAPVSLIPDVKPAPVVMPVPVHQIAVQKVVPQSVECVQKYYPFGKYDNVWPSYGVGKSPMMYSYGVYSDKVGESFQVESSDTLSYQVYIPATGTYTLKYAVDNSGYMSIDGTRYIDLTKITSQSPYTSQLENYQSDHPTTIQLTEGWKTVDLFYKNWGGPHSVAALISYEGRIVWTSRDAYNQKDYQECSVGTKPVTQPSEDCVNPKTIFKFTGNVDHTLRITLTGTKVTYSNEQYHGTLPRTVSEFSNNGVGPYNTNLTIKWAGRGSVQISQQPNSSNNYTAIIDIFDGKGGEGTYNLEVFQLKCSQVTPIRKALNESNGTAYGRPVNDGGGGCPAVWQLMETKELGVVEARHIKVGMHLKDSQPGVWNRVNVAYIAVAPIYRVDIDGQVFDVDHSHKWYLGNDNWVKVTDIKSGNYVETSDGTKVRVNSVHYLRDDQYMHMNVDNERYIMGTNIIGHNAMTDRQFLARKR